MTPGSTWMILPYIAMLPHLPRGSWKLAEYLWGYLVLVVWDDHNARVLGTCCGV